MLTVYSTQGSPGASTTAMHLAAHWASTGREILLIEADPAGGSLSHNLGIQFTPGSASFVASGLPVLSHHLIDHAQDVLFESLHVMPAPASPTGARGIFEILAEAAEDLRSIAENEMAVIIDGGRITSDTAGSALTTAAAGVVVVCRPDSQLSSLKLLERVLDPGPSGDGPVGCAVTVGKSPMSAEEWQESCGLTFCGSIEILTDTAADLSAYLNRNKRKSKKWRVSLEQVADGLYGYAQPPVSDRSRRRRAEAASASGADQSAAPAAPVPDPLAARDPGGGTQAAPLVEPQPAYGQAPPPLEPQPGYGYDPAPQPAYPHPEPPPPGYGYPPGYEYPPPPEQPPGYEYPPPPEQRPGYEYPPHPEQPPGYGFPGPAPEPQPGYGPSHYLPPAGWLDDPQGYGQPQPMAPPESPPAHGQAPPPASTPVQHPVQPPEQPQPSGYGPAPHPSPSHGPAEPQPQTPAPPDGHLVPVSPDRLSAGAEQQPEEPRPAPELQPTGSFRDWAARLHGSKAGDTAAQNRGV